MEINICKDKNSWEKEAVSHGCAEFLQSWEWGEFQQSVGNQCLRLQIVEEGAVKGQIQGFVHRLPLGFNYLYIPRANANSLKLVISNWKMVEKELEVNYRFVFARIEPTSPITDCQLPITITQNRQPDTTLLLDLSQSEGDLLSQMHNKTRYNINLAERKGVRIESEKGVDIFWKLNQETKKRDDFKTHDKSYYEKMLQSPIVRQLIAYYEGKPTASDICICYGDAFTYLHGASSNNYRNLMAPYLLQWGGIKLAKSLNCKYYDFWGISPSARHKIQDTRYKQPETCFHGLCWQADHPWTGVTRFKAGFGGFAKEYPGAVDVVFKKASYKLYQLLRTLKRF